MVAGPLIAIVGQTASGKSGLALALAERFGGEIICADSRTVYRGMDIGTAKPTTADRAQVPHWGLDLIDPDVRYTVADFKTYTLNVIRDIAGRGKVPILVGGTGLYIDAVLYDFAFRGPADERLRAELDGLGVGELQQRLLDAGLELPGNDRNPRHLVRAIEAGGVGAARGELRAGTLVLGTAVPADELQLRIAGRVEQMLAAGLEAEARGLRERYGWNVPGMQTIGYREWPEYFEGGEVGGGVEGRQTLQETADLIALRTRQLAKRQQTWFKRNKSIQWLVTEDKLRGAVEIVTTFLNK